MRLQGPDANSRKRAVPNLLLQPLGAGMKAHFAFPFLAALLGACGMVNSQPTEILREAASRPTLAIPTSSHQDNPAADRREPGLNATELPTPIPPTPTPRFAEVELIGLSVENRPLTVVRFGYGDHERLIVAGIHGGYEWNTIRLAEALIETLRDVPEGIPQDITLYIMTTLNPDGAARSQDADGRGNSNGVDLNRNWPSHWSPTWSPEGCWNYRDLSAGEGPASEPEVAALREFILSRDIEAIISYHSAGLGIFPGGSPPTESSVDLALRLASVSPYPYPPIDTGCEYTGQFIDWAADQGIAAVDVELSNHREIELEINLQVIEAFLSWNPMGR